MWPNSLRLSIFVIISCTLPLQAALGDVSTASIYLSGYVPEVFVVTAKSLNSDIVLAPNTKVTQQPIGAVSFRYNQDIAGISISSSTESGAPENQDGAYHFQEPFTVGLQGPCQSLNTKALSKKGIQLNPEGIELKSKRAGQLTQSGIDEECILTANWKSGKTVSAKPGVYSMNVQVTISAQ